MHSFIEMVEANLEPADDLLVVAQVLAEDRSLSHRGANFAGERRLLHASNFWKTSTLLEIEQGRHPVVELVRKRESLGLAGTHAFVPNDCLLSSRLIRLPSLRGPLHGG